MNNQWTLAGKMKMIPFLIDTTPKEEGIIPQTWLPIIPEGLTKVNNTLLFTSSVRDSDVHN